ncbi:hypothetical protein QTI24_20850 [Variovorax sp. J22P240]|uniref:hypothetical protein n=1 Tax=unclassified Variovorax TaxID=663243 RepID=UPI0025753E53|nr:MULTISPECIES: hypothetical protein [unclassified Variovorax]MDM0001071.1 hypothetical protein [Variovorax sp. J22P240]MDM0049835.1 hypothetical protein [Variovorax sp. J22R115]
MNQLILKEENMAYQGCGGVSADNRCYGFRPAFRNTETGHVYPSRFADGRLAPIHMIGGLPDELVVSRSAAGGVISVKDSVQSGFTLNGRFYDRDEAASYLESSIPSR